jgi:hypothetical protein
MTLICDFCKKPLLAAQNKPLTLGETTLDFHPDCNPKWIDRIVNGTPPPPPAPAPTVAQAIIERPKPQKGGFWSGRRGKKDQLKERTDEELAGAFG